MSLSQTKQIHEISVDNFNLYSIGMGDPLLDKIIVSRNINIVTFVLMDISG